ncbi:hypothetical protein ACFQ0B_77935 [Nonomuraea thailandensis]
MTISSFAADPPSGLTMSPWRRCKLIRNPGWFGEHGIPVKNGWPSSTTRTPSVTAASRASSVDLAVCCGRVVMLSLLGQWRGGGGSSGEGEHDAGAFHHGGVDEPAVRIEKGDLATGACLVGSLQDGLCRAQLVLGRLKDLVHDGHLPRVHDRPAYEPGVPSDFGGPA